MPIHEDCASMTMDKSDADALRNAVQLLEHASLAARLANMIGKPVELLGRALPAGASQAIATATTKSLEAAVKVALLTVRGGSQASSQMLHRALAVASGAAGGAFGIVSLPLELPVSTIIILRSILDIARSEGEDLADPESSLSCVEVFGLGGRTEADDAAEGGYFVARGVFATSVTEAARFIAERGIVEEGSPVLVRLIAQIASRFGFVVSQKAAAQTIPVIGALGGAAINYAFIDHFQSVARGHFTVRRLERKYGKDIVFEEYERFRQDLNAPKR
jgi:EcsC family protein